MWPHIGSSNDIALLKPKRRKIDIACKICRLRKSRCDGGRPKCGACMRRKNVGTVCVYSEHPLDSSLLSTTIPSLDRSIRSASVSIHSPHSQAGFNSPEMVSMTSERIASQATNTVSPSLSQTVPESRLLDIREPKDTPGTENTVENNSNWILKAGLLAASSSTNFFNTVFGTSDAERVTDDGQNDPNKNTDDTALAGRPHRSSMHQSRIHSPEYVLPSRKVADNLIKLFFKHAYIHWIDRLGFMHWYEGLWIGDREPGDPVQEQIHYAHLNIIFALTYQTEPEQLTEDQGQLAQTYFLRAQRLLQLDLLELNRLDLLYALLLLMQWFQSVNDVRQCISLLRLCIVTAHNLGLHIPEKTESLPSQRSRELAHRAWHGCILMDRITAMISGQPLQISQDNARRSPLFQAIDDEYLGSDKTNGVQPVGKPAIPTFFLAFCQLHIVLGDILTKFHNTPNDTRSVADVNHIIEVDDNLDHFYRSLPADLRIEKDDSTRFSPTGPIINLHTRFLHIRILLYRVFFLRAAKNLKHADSSSSKLFADAITHQGLLACVRTAQEILNLINSCFIADNRDPHLVPPRWHIVTYVYTASTILIAAHIFPAVLREVEPSSLVASITQGFHILDKQSNGDKSAQRCKMALMVLCERHVNLNNGRLSSSSNESPRHIPNGRILAHDTLFSHGLEHVDAAQISADFGWDFIDPSDLFRGEGMESLLFSAHLFGQETSGWL